MKKECRNCSYCIIYMQKNNLFLCNLKTRGLIEYFTLWSNTCPNWKKREKLNLTKWKNSIKKYHQKFPQTEDLY